MGFIRRITRALDAALFNDLLIVLAGLGLGVAGLVVAWLLLGLL